MELADFFGRRIDDRKIDDRKMASLTKAMATNGSDVISFVSH